MENKPIRSGTLKNFIRGRYAFLLPSSDFLFTRQPGRLPCRVKRMELPARFLISAGFSSAWVASHNAVFGAAADLNWPLLDKWQPNAKTFRDTGFRKSLWDAGCKLFSKRTHSQPIY
jgi:hypothetical protein